MRLSLEERFDAASNAIRWAIVASLLVPPYAMIEVVGWRPAVADRAGPPYCLHDTYEHAFDVRGTHLLRGKLVFSERSNGRSLIAVARRRSTPSC